jgi:hypothetical protein
MTTTFGIGNVFATGVRIWIRNLVPFTVIAALLHAPLLIWGLAVSHVARGRLLILESLGSSFLQLLIGVVVSGALTYGVVMELSGQRASIGACITTGFTRLLPVLAVGLLTGLAVGGATLLLIVPGFIVMCMLYVTTQVAVIERPGISASLGRSSELTRGHRWAIFGLMVLVAVIGGACQVVLQLATASLVDSPERLLRTPLYICANFGLTVLLGSFGAVLSGVAYYLLRAEKDGTSADELARIFD